MSIISSVLIKLIIVAIPMIIWHTVGFTRDDWIITKSYFMEYFKYLFPALDRPVSGSAFLSLILSYFFYMFCEKYHDDKRWFKIMCKVLNFLLYCIMALYFVLMSMAIWKMSMQK